MSEEGRQNMNICDAKGSDKSVDTKQLQGKRKLAGTDLDVPILVQNLLSKEARLDILNRQKTKMEADSKLATLYEEVENVPKDQILPPNLIDKYFDVKRDVYLADIDYHLSVIRNMFFANPPLREQKEKIPEGLEKKDILEMEEKDLDEKQK